MNPELEEKEYCADEIEEEPEIKKKTKKKAKKEKVIFSTIQIKMQREISDKNTLGNALNRKGPKN